MIPPDDLLRKLWRALVRVDEDRDTFGDAFLWMHRHPCEAREWGRRFVTRFYFMRKERWSADSRFVPLDSAYPPPEGREDDGEDDDDDSGHGKHEENETRFINTLRDAIHKETHKDRDPKKKGRRRP